MMSLIGSFDRTSLGIDFTSPSVATNASSGVKRLPWGVLNSPVRARVFLSLERILNSNIAFNYIREPVDGIILSRELLKETDPMRSVM